MRFILLLVFAFSANLGFATGKPTITGNMPRSNTPSYIPFTITVSGITTDAAAGVSTTDNIFTDRIRVYLTKNYASTGTDLGTCGTGDFVTEQTNSGPERTGTLSSGYTLVFSVRVKPCNSSKTIADQFVSTNSKSVAMKIGFRDSKTSTDYAETEVTLTAVASLPSDAPSLSSLKTDDSTLVANFSASTTPTYLDTKQYSTSNVVAYLIDVDAIQSNTARFLFPTRILNTDSAATEDTVATDGQKCTYVMNTSNCVVCNTANSYIDADNISGSYITVLKRATNATTASFAGLVNGKTYAVFMTYENGVKPTTCLTGTPAKTYTLAENLGEDETKSSDPKCFIATAAYGNPWHPNINLFRWFRDHVLLKFNLGERFVNYYYENSPPLAQYISQHKTLAKIIAAILWVPAAFIYLLKTLALNPKLLAGCSLISIALLGAWVNRRRKLRA